MTDTPKSKAFDIISKYCGKDCTLRNIKRQKRNAIILLNEILSIEFKVDSDKEFWNKVKEEVISF